MVYGIIQWVIISLILIMLVHHLFSFFKDTLTVPKVKDLVNQPSESYKEIEKTLNESGSTNIANLVPSEKIDQAEMKNELKNFFDNLRQNKEEKTKNIPQSFNQSNNTDTNHFSSF